MIQALVKKGRVLPTEVPAPRASPGTVLVKVVSSAISTGTEVAGVESSGKSVIRRALEQPENIRKAYNMARTAGIPAVVTRVLGRDQPPSPTGYSIAGVVIGVGEGVAGIPVGMRVAAAGAGVANHAEYVEVPQNLLVPIPDQLGFRDASTVALGAIAMQGVRRARLELGEFVVVVGVGGLGQLVVQMAVASGCRVIAVDIDAERLELAKRFGAQLCLNPAVDDPLRVVRHLTGGHGADAAVFCAATDQPRVLSDAFAMVRRKGRLVMVGVWGKELARGDVYPKEIDFLISTSYGPGRYDEDYETRGVDYPYAYVRWTENRNMEEYLRLLSCGTLQVEPLVKAAFPIAEVEQAFARLGGDDRPLMVLLDYGEQLPGMEPAATMVRSPAHTTKSDGRVRVALIGAGSFAAGVHLPGLKKLGKKYELWSICDRVGSNASGLASRFGARYATTDHREVLADADVDLIMVCTRHDLHGQLVLDGLTAGKHVFVEKPLCTTQAELEAIRGQIEARDSGPLLMVGFNRRFSRHARIVREQLARRVNPAVMHYRMNAGYIPLDHWVHTEEGGGRIIGEACHIIDLFLFLVGHPVRAYSVGSLHPNTSSVSSSDNRTLVIEFEDGSLATLEYFAVGSRELSKEVLEVHFDEKSIILDDYRRLDGHGVELPSSRSAVASKGHLEELDALWTSLTRPGTPWPISWQEIMQTTELSIQAAM